MEKKYLIPRLKSIRRIQQSFAWIDHRLIRNGYLQVMTHEDLALYVCLLLAADCNGVSFYSKEKICDILSLDVLNEDDLYENLDWLCENQATIENRLFKQMFPDKAPTLYLYDVTSSYLEGTENELGAFGYNRDGKKGKQQIESHLMILVKLYYVYKHQRLIPARCYAARPSPDVEGR